MGIDQMLEQAHDAMHVKRVFGDPIERDGVTLIPVARVRGMGGRGSGEGPEGQGKGSGAGFGVASSPAGVYVITDGDVRWRPAVDATRIALMGQLVAIVFFLTLRSIAKSIARARSGAKRP